MQFRRPAATLLGEIRLATAQATMDREADLAKQYAELHRQLVAAASPILEQLQGVLWSIRTRPDAEEIARTIMREQGAGEAVPRPAVPAAKIPDFAPRRQPQLLHPRPRPEAEPESDDSPEMAMDLAGVDHGD